MSRTEHFAFLPDASEQYLPLRRVLPGGGFAPS
jgi:hypothetical protein